MKQLEKDIDGALTMNEKIEIMGFPGYLLVEEVIESINVHWLQESPCPLTEPLP